MLSESSPPSNVVSDSQRGSSVRDVLNRVIEMDIRKASTAEYKDRNILSLGYRSQRWHSDLEVKDSLGIECYFVNTVHSFFMSRHWEVVLSRLGDRGLQHVMSRPVMLPVGSSHVQVRRTHVMSLSACSYDELMNIFYALWSHFLSFYHL